jgi:hypothetical protein
MQESVEKNILIMTIDYPTAWEERFGTLKYQFSKWKWPFIRLYKTKHQWELHTNHWPYNFIANSIALHYTAKDNWVNERDDFPAHLRFQFGWEEIVLTLGKGKNGTRHHLLYFHLISKEGIKTRRFL